MSYIGQQLPADVFSGYVTDTFTGDGSATTFTLSKAPFSADSLIVVVDNVIQQPTVNFTVSGTTLTIVGTAILSGIKGYAIHTGGPVASTLASKVDVNGLSDGIILDADGDTTISADTDDQIDFKAGGTDIMSLTATTATFNDGVEITVNDNSNTLKLISTDADATNGPNLRFTRDSASPANSDDLGRIIFSGDNNAGEETNFATIQSRINSVTDGSEFGEWELDVMNNGTLRSILKVNDSAITINDDSQDINFTIESNGVDPMFKVDAGMDQVSVNTTSDLSASLGIVGAGERAMFIAQTLNQDTSVAIWKNVYANGSNSATMIQFTNSGNTEVGSIKSTGSATAFNTSSDYRLKENVDYTWDATTRLKQLKPARFNWIADDANTLEDGFLAHEVSSIVPEAITGTKDAAITLTKAVIGEHGNVIAENIEESAWTAGKADGTYDAQTTWHASKVNPIYQQIDLGKLVPLLVKTAQELEARIKALEDA
jgi:hypothetical protein